MKGLRLRMPIREVKLDIGMHPMLKATDWVSFMDRHGFWDKLFGTTNDLKEGKMKLASFWHSFKQLYPGFEVFGTAAAAGIPMENFIPCYIHGDEGTHYKKSGVMILQFQSAIGQGTTLNADPKTNDKKHIKVNQLGVTLCTRFLLSVLPKEAYANDPRPLDQLFEHICLDLREACHTGVQLADGTFMHLAPIGVKGDWPFLETRLTCRIIYAIVFNHFFY